MSSQAAKLIPKDFYPTALSELNRSTAVAYYNKERNLLMFTIGEKTLGPIEPTQLETLMHVMTDVKEMKFRYHPITIPPEIDPNA